MTGEIAAPLYEVCGTKVSRDTISRIPDKVVKEMIECKTGHWATSPSTSRSGVTERACSAEPSSTVRTAVCARGSRQIDIKTIMEAMHQ